MARMNDLPPADLSPYTAAQIELAVAAWPMRAAEELRSAMIFRALTRAAVTCVAPEPWPSRFASAMHDEVRHARLCATVGTRLGASAPRYDAKPVKQRLAKLVEPRRRMLTLLLIEVAAGETISASLFRAGRRAAVEPLTRAALTSIVADETRHRDLGWAAARALLPTYADDRERNALLRDVAAGLASFEQTTARPALLRLQSGEPFDPAYGALGVLAPEARVDAFYTAVEQLVVPRLEELGLDGARAWRDRYRLNTFA
jgi:hypothetical protein